MAKKKSEAGGRDAGLTVRVPLETLEKLREILPEAKAANPLLESEADVLRMLAQRAMAIGVASKRLLVTS